MEMHVKDKNEAMLLLSRLANKLGVDSITDEFCIYYSPNAL